MIKKRITLLCSSYPPEIGAASSRMFHLANMLQTKGHKVTVIAAMPNYPTGKIFEGYKRKIYHQEYQNGICIFRSWLIPSNAKNPIKRGLSMLSYAVSLFTIALPKILSSHPEIIIVSSPPFVTGYLGSIIAKFTNAKIVLNISDLWPLSASELGFIEKSNFYNFLQRREHSMYRRADAISVQSKEIQKNIASVIHNKEIFLYRNLQPPIAQAAAQRPSGNRKIVYAGLLGVAQGVYDICAAINFKQLGCELHIYGAGNEREKIETFIAQNIDRGIYYHGWVPADEMTQLMTQYHIVLIPLKTSIYGAVPSKIFNAMANGLPILFSGNGEASEIIKQYHIGFTNHAGDYSSLKKNIERMILMGDAEYTQIRNNCLQCAETEFNKSIQDNAFIDFLNAI
jgi:glycosyltransferase involved in cell wall biosynthesis